MKKLIVLMLLVASSTSLYAKKTMLEMNLKEGQIFTSTSVVEMDITQSMLGMDIELRMGIKFNSTSTVKGIEERGYLLEIVYDYAEAKGEGMGVSMVVTSNDTINNEMTTIIRAMLNNPLLFVMSKNGQVIDFLNYDEVISNMSEELIRLDKQQMADMFDKMYSKNSLMNNIGAGKSFAYPDHPIAKGHKWNAQGSFDNIGMALNVDTEYEFKGKKKGYWIVVAKSMLTAPSESVDMENGFKLEGDGTMDIEIKIDPATGWAVESKNLANFEGNVSMAGCSDIKIPMKLKVDTTITSQPK